MIDQGVLILAGALCMVLIVADGLRRRRKSHKNELAEEAAAAPALSQKVLTSDHPEQQPIDAEVELMPEPAVHREERGKSLSAGCHIGPATTVHGHLIARESVIIKGCILGAVLAENQRVHLASGAHVTASIKGGQVTIDGKVEGDIHATQRLALLQKADVLGNVTTVRFDCLSGAKLHGRVMADSEVG
ncbi:polymer-forming cytoskeletal protein [Halomonas sp. TBZ9]|uniref:Polymer-forming cytoskeletal protein n=1 Tax=Vreelandella azerica TaxID=2732867 RepID=A0A7Y3XAQ9_9GAMM|nr:polymer-forming cytoskeletal protein [Halomonas azerica]NOG31516.1 polymer-forming cytoskeletal protein [Halomonas azerica]